MEILVGAVILWVVPVFVAHAIGKPKLRAGVLYGLCLGWLGVIIVALLPARPDLTLAELEKKKNVLDPRYYEQKRAELQASNDTRECPFCKEAMRRDASVCPHCQRDSVPWTLHEGLWWQRVNDQWLYLNPGEGWLKATPTGTAPTATSES